MPTVLLVAAGGALGAVTRYGVGVWLARRDVALPWATLLVNVLGCLALGALMVWVSGRDDLAPRVRAFVGIGLLGSLTTFSTFGLETVELMRQGETSAALTHVALNLGLGLGAVLVGRAAALAVLD